jgi:hypothetical protein
MTHPKVDYNDNMVEMMEDDEDWGKKVRLRLIIGKTVICTGLFLTFFLYLLTFISEVSDDLADFGRVIIEDIHYFNVYQVESDGDIELTNVIVIGEYAVIKNNGFTNVNLEGWRLNTGDPGEDFYFPLYTLRPWHSCRVYTNETHLTFCGLNFGIERSIWDSSDCGYLYDNKGVLVDEYCRYGTWN